MNAGVIAEHATGTALSEHVLLGVHLWSVVVVADRLIARVDGEYVVSLFFVVFLIAAAHGDLVALGTGACRRGGCGAVATTAAAVSRVNVGIQTVLAAG